VTNLQRRLKKLETRTAPPKPPRLVVRYVGCDGLDPEYPQADINETDENTMLVVVEYVDRPPKAPLRPTR
jgi:hypothetical protein